MPGAFTVLFNPARTSECSINCECIPWSQWPRLWRPVSDDLCSCPFNSFGKVRRIERERERGACHSDTDTVCACTHTCILMRVRAHLDTHTSTNVHNYCVFPNAISLQVKSLPNLLHEALLLGWMGFTLFSFFKSSFEMFIFFLFI